MNKNRCAILTVKFRKLAILFPPKVLFVFSDFMAAEVLK